MKSSRRLDFRLAVVLLPMSAVAADLPAAQMPAPRVELIGPALRSTDLERSKQFYIGGLGMVVAREINMGSVTELILSFNADKPQPVLLLYKDATPGKAPPIEQGNGFGRLVLRVTDAVGLATRLKSAGYTVGEIRSNSVNNMKTFWATDPDGYKYEITELPAAK